MLNLRQTCKGLFINLFQSSGKTEENTMGMGGGGDALTDLWKKITVIIFQLKSYSSQYKTVILTQYPLCMGKLWKLCLLKVLG